VRWSVDSAPAHWMPKLDQIAIDCLDPAQWAERRWLRLSPRYLGRLAQSMRLIYCDRGFGASFIEQVRTHAENGEIGVSVAIQMTYHGGDEEHRITPRNPGRLA
jgi:hypothetical protein